MIFRMIKRNLNVKKIPQIHEEKRTRIYISMRLSSQTKYYLQTIVKRKEEVL